MSQENVEIMRRLFAAFQNVDVGDFERRLDEVRESGGRCAPRESGTMTAPRS